MGRVAIIRTVIPLEYDSSTEGFNNWVFWIRNQVHCPDKNFTINSIIPAANQVIKFHQVPLNKY